MHNKVSHSKTNIGLKTKIFKRLLQKADCIFTHSKEGIVYGKNIYDNAKIMYFPHPVSSAEFTVNSETVIKYDILIWGMMTPYKGVLEFVEYMQKKSIYNFKILIAGKFISENYFNSVKAFASDNITIINEFVEKNELLEYVSASKIILFTYDNSSVLSSGVLADSITFNAHIVGPNTGSFTDLAAEGIVHTYNSFDNLFPILTKLKEESYSSDNKISYLKSITWSSYGQFINDKLF
ncbi:MAG: hypothetical protein IPO21_01920 [Bacteroidales bacterium]|nr:hypothetical protein [Bacteroidales bacterium]